MLSCYLFRYSADRPARCRREAGDIDLDGDGEISFEEFRQMMEDDPTAVTTGATTGTGTPASTGA